MGEKNILIADDDSANRLLLKLRIQKYHKDNNLTQPSMYAAANGEEAVKQVYDLKGSIDLIIMDIKMPTLDGLQATKQIHETYKTIPIVAHSAYMFMDLIANNNLFANTLRKPLQTKELEAILKKYIT